MSTQVRITNTYPDRSNAVTVTVQSPWTWPDGLEGWWEDTVFPHTGDGRGASQYAIYSAEVTDSDVPDLIGAKYEWDG